MSVFEAIKTGLEEAISYEEGELQAKKTKVKIVVNKIRCNKCGDEIESTYTSCQNDNCDYKHKKIKCTITDKYCMKCGQPLHHVCANPNCGTILSDDLEKYCPACIEQAEANRQKHIETAKGVVKVAANVVPAALAAVPKAGKAIKGIQKVLPKK